ncbi:MAG: DUF6531 domain-containing protein, partial [Acidobacteria bacterium]|nr:DUF6531 domain-containing protein [Acidobacteriota bacterium]
GQTVYVYIADSNNHRIRRLDSVGTVIKLAGLDRGFKDGTANDSRFADPTGVTVDGAGHVIIADTTNSLVREIDPVRALNGDPNAVYTLAGTGERGLTNGAGNVAKFNKPGGVAVLTSGTIIVADTANQVLRKILLPPVITALNPAQGEIGTSVTISGNRFDERGPNFNTVRFTAASGTVTAAVSTATRTQLTVTVPAGAVTGPVSVQTQGGTATSPTNFIIGTIQPPVIADFNPKSGRVGAVATITGTSLKSAFGNPSVTFAGAGGARLEAFVSSATATEVRVTVPNGAMTGRIELENTLGRALTDSPFTVDPSQDFQITVAPSTATAVQGSTGTFVVSLTSTQPNFSQLAKLSVTGAPAGATVSFTPEQITAGAMSTLSLVLPGTVSPTSYSLTISAKAMVDGVEITRTATATLTVQSGAGQTTLSGRVLSTESESIPGATVSLDGKSATTDASGSFLLSGITAGADRPVMVDGRTANVPNRRYPIITEPITIVAGQANIVPYIFYLPAIDIDNEVPVIPGQTTIVTTPKVPGLVMTIPADANLRNRDGSPVTRVSLSQVEIDRTPAPLPPNIGTNVVYTAQPGTARPAPGKVMPVVYPNLAGTNPGARIELWNFDPDTAQWYIYGFGRVSADGRTIAPEPGVGLPYFSWHTAAASPGGNPGGGGPGSNCNTSPSCPSGYTPCPVDLSTGIKVEFGTDISFGGARGGLELTRTYTSDLAVFSGLCVNCPFGRGTTHNYAISLTFVNSFVQGGAGRVVRPGERTGRLFSYAGADSDGALVFKTIATTAQLADVVRKLTNGTFEYRKGNGEVWRFDASGRPTAMVDRNGNTTTLSYTGSNLTRITDAVGRSITLEYDGSNRIVQATDPLGRLWRYGYGGGNSLVTVTDPQGNVTRYGYGIAGLLTSVTDERGFVKKKITYETDIARVIKQEFADGGFETYDYKLSGTVVTETKVTDSLGRVRTMRFSAAGYVIGMTDELGQSSIIQRDMTTNLNQETTGPCGCLEARREFDNRGNLLALIDRLGQRTEYQYEPSFNFVTQIKDALGRIMRMGYDNRGNRTSMTDALGRMTTYAYDSFGQLISMTDPLGHTTRYSYDANGYINKVTDALGNENSFEYDAVGRLEKTTDGEGRSTSNSYDNNDRIISVTDPAGVVTRFEYDENDNRTAIINAQNKRWSFVYDAKNRLTGSTDPLNQTTQYRFNTDDEMVAMISPSGRTTSYEYDGRGQRTKMIDPLKGEIRFTYDSQKNLTTLTDERGNTTTFTYDELYRRIAQRDPLGLVMTSSYDAVGNLIEKVDRLNRLTKVDYDALNRPVTVTYVDAFVGYSFDEAGRLTSISDTQSTGIAWTYDDANRMLSESTLQGRVSYTYNKANQRISMTAADRPKVSYEYDTAGRHQKIIQGAETFMWSYDDLSRMKNLQRPNGVTTTYSYDAANKLNRITHANASGVALEDLQYGYNTDDEIESINSLASGTLLPTAKTASAADAANRIARFGQAGYTFDEEGQTRTKTDGQGTTSYDWDARGRLTKVTLPSDQSVSYSYDTLGRRVTRTANGLATTFLSDDQDVVLDRSSGGILTEYLNGPGIDNKLRQVSAGTGALYFLQDHLGSTIAQAGASGGIVERQSYEAFGAGAGSSLSRYAYTGRERDPETDIYYYRARYYNPGIGRFISEDPLRFIAGRNFFIYVQNSPVNWKDPVGLGEGFWSDLWHWIKETATAAAGSVAEALGHAAKSPYPQAVGVGVELVAVPVAAAVPTIELVKIHVKEQQNYACAFGAIAWCACRDDPDCGAMPRIPPNPQDPIPDPPPHVCKIP